MKNQNDVKCSRFNCTHNKKAPAVRSAKTGRNAVTLVKMIRKYADRQQTKEQDNI